MLRSAEFHPAAVSCGAATGSLKSTPQQAYNQLLSINNTNYCSGAWRLLSMLLMTGNFLMWNATPTQSGKNVSAKDSGWNGAISGGGS